MTGKTSSPASKARSAASMYTFGLVDEGNSQLVAGIKSPSCVRNSCLTLVDTYSAFSYRTAGEIENRSDR
jgi:hypothetical protein